MKVADLHGRFEYHAPTEEKKDHHQDIRTLHHDLAVHLVATLPDGRELSLALTKLEESMFWANAAVARNG